MIAYFLYFTDAQARIKRDFVPFDAQQEKDSDRHTHEILSGGFILFDEFASWAIKQRLDLELLEDLEELDENDPKNERYGFGRREPEDRRRPRKKNGIDWEDLAYKLPIRSTAEDRERRRSVFFDKLPKQNRTDCYLISTNYQHPTPPP